MKGKILIDTMYLSVRYPKADVFNKWYPRVQSVPHQILKQGIEVNNFVLKTGSSGYKYSIWKHDARAFLTDEVDEIRGEGKGMGIWLQLGPKFLIQHANNIHEAVKQFLYQIGVNDECEIRITRIDVALDLFNESMKDQEISLWQNGWVGRSKLSKLCFNSRTGELETIYIGSRKSPVYLRVYDKKSQAIQEGDIEYWLDVWGNNYENVTRVEWEVKPREGNFSDDLSDFSKFNGFSVVELMNYLLEWGRLCIPDSADQNRNRWEETIFWQKVRTIVKQWADGITWPVSRFGKEYKGISEQYLKQAAGVISGAMARFWTVDPDIGNLFEGFERFGISFQSMNRKAKDKYAVISNL